jgi:aminopeptidase S
MLPIRIREHTMRLVHRMSLAAAGVAVLLTGSQLSAAGAPDGPTATVAPAPDIPIENVQAHLAELQRIADENGGDRATGQPGYRASVDWVAATLEAAGYVVTVQEFTTWFGETSWNVIAETSGGDPGSVVMAGAHLDAVVAGINDNGSGSAGVLETALQWAASGQTPTSKLRFAFWGAEEQGLIGSSHYVETLPADQLSAIQAYLNFDMIGSPNPGYFVYDDNPAGTELRDLLTAEFAERGIQSEYIDVGGRSDHASFIDAGIPTGGTFTGAEGIKSADQAAKWGGTAGQPFDVCYHQACDTVDNIDAAALDAHADVIADVVWQLAGAGASELDSLAPAA